MPKRHLISFVLLAAALSHAPAQAQDPISYHEQIRPLLQARCAGCHRPGKRKGRLDLTSYAAFAKGGKHAPAFVAGKPDKSFVIKQIRGPDPEMPAEGEPLTKAQVDLFARWIEAGAKDDTPAPVRPLTVAPVRYESVPPTTALGYSPDGGLLAVAGYGEVLLHAADGSGLVARLVGDAPRIESLAFSRDGKLLAVAAGTPGTEGEIQIWDVARRTRQHVYRVADDTIFGVSFSPDGRRVAFGCADRTARMVRVADGKELLRFRNHADWVLGTTFTKNGKRLVTAGRDKAMKIVDLATNRFVDDINNPLEKIYAIARHPAKDLVVYGGDLGVPRIYKISDNQQRTSARRDTNLVRAFERQSGPVHAVAWSPSGTYIAAGGVDAIVYIYEVKTGKLTASVRGHRGPVFALDFAPSGKQLAVGGFDGTVRIYNVATGRLVRAFTPVPCADADSAAPAELVVSLSLSPRALVLTDGADQRGLLVAGLTASGKRVDLTAAAVLEPATDTVAVTEDGFVVPKKAGKTHLTVKAAGLTASMPVEVKTAKRPEIHFARDVMPILDRAGCNAGTCHGARAGKNGFALSLRGFDPAADYAALVHDLNGRRLDRVRPERSLMLQKPTAEVPHEGQKVLEVGSRHYRALLQWIREGTRFRDDDRSHVTGLVVMPEKVELDQAGQRQRVLVLAKFADGSTADVTRDAVLSVSNTEVTRLDGLTVTGLRRGESAVLVRFRGCYTAAPVTVMGDRRGFAWKPEPESNFIDEHVDAKLRAIKALPSPLCTDAEFVRRLYLDLTGKPPRPEVAKAFVRDRAPDKRNHLIDALIGGPDYVEHWANKWADLLQCRSKTLGEKGMWVFRRWISRAIAENEPYDEFVRELVTARGSTYERPAANYMRTLSDRGRKPDPSKMAEDVTQTFLGVRFSCCKCHNHPFERWTQDQYYQIAAQFTRVRYKKGGEPGEIVVYDSFTGGETQHPRTSMTVAPGVPYGAATSPAERRRERFAEWLTSKDNAYFARSYVNRVWSYLFGTGIIEPVDDIRAGNPPSNPALLDALEKSFVDSGFDFNALVRTICRSRAWQRSFRSNKWNADDKINFSHYVPRRLSAEQLEEAIALACGVETHIQGLPDGARPVEAADGVVPGDDFLQLFGRPKRESACECARTSNLSLAHALNLVGGKRLHSAIVSPTGRVTRLVAAHQDNRKVVSEIYWAALSRAPTAKELDELCDLGQGDQRLLAAQDLMWALTNTPAFLFNR